MPFTCPCGSDEFYTYGDERFVWYVDSNGDVIDSGDCIDSFDVGSMPYRCSNCDKEYSQLPPLDNEAEWVKQKERAYMNHPNRCPMCDGTDLDAGSIEIDGRSAWQNLYCLSCGTEWTDTYYLNHGEITSYPTDMVPEDMQPPEVPDPNEAFNNK